MQTLEEIKESLREISKEEGLEMSEEQIAKLAEINWALQSA